MRNPRIRKRVHAIRRGPDGSAFQNCESCGVSVAVALLDMHECEPNKGVKRFRGVCGSESTKVDVLKQSFDVQTVQPRSPFHFFMESFMKTCNDENLVDSNKKGFEVWKKMSYEERKPYITQAEKVDSAYQKALLKEACSMLKVDDEADSAMVGKFDQYHEDCADHVMSDSYECYGYIGSEGLNTHEWEMVKSWICEESD